MVLATQGRDYVYIHVIALFIVTPTALSSLLSFNCSVGSPEESDDDYDSSHDEQSDSDNLYVYIVIIASARI